MVLKESAQDQVGLLCVSISAQHLEDSWPHMEEEMQAGLFRKEEGSNRVVHGWTWDMNVMLILRAEGERTDKQKSG